MDEKMVPHFKTGTETLRRLNGDHRPASADPRHLGHMVHCSHRQPLSARDGAGALPRLRCR